MKSIRRIILIITVLLFAASLASCKKGEYDAPAGWVTASDEKADFYFYVPDEWTVDYSTAAAGAYFSESDPSSVSVMAWDLEYTDTTVDQWWEINKGELDLVFENVTLISEDNATVDEYFGKTYVYTATLGEFSYKFMQTAVVKNAEVYLFTYTSTPEKFDSHLEDVDAMLDYLILK